MATLFRPTTVRYVDQNGSRRDSDGNLITKNTPGARAKRERSKVWRIKYKDAAGKVRTASLGTEDREEAQERLSDFLRRLKRNESDRFAEHRERSLSEHLVDFRRHLESKNSSAKHIDKVLPYVTRVFEACGFQIVTDLDANRVADYLHERRKPVAVSKLSVKQAAVAVTETVGLSDPPVSQLRRISKVSLPAPDVAARRGSPARWSWSAWRAVLQREFRCELPRQCPLPDEPGMSISASNDYVACLKNFANWMVRSQRIPENPFRHLSKLNADTDPMHQRRPADPGDFARLLAATADGKPFRGLTGYDRVMLYLVATTTGFRASELASLSAGSFDFAASVPTVQVQAAYSKRRRHDQEPLRQDLADVLRGYVEDVRRRRYSDTLSIHQSGQPLWPGSWPDRAAEMLRGDLEAAGIPYQDDEGRFLDFHALRHTFGTNLAKAGVPPKVAQELMRHSDVKLTLNTYSHVGLHDLAGAIEQLPSVPALTEVAQTGTDSVVAPVVALKTGNIGSSQELSEATSEQSVELANDSGVRHKPKRGQEVTAFESAHKKEPPMRLELMTYALRKRRSAD